MSYRLLPTLALCLPLLMAFPNDSQAQPATTLAPSAPLSDYAGTYQDAPGTTLEIVSGHELFAVQDDAKYRLHPTGPDEFANAWGQKIPFRRDTHGQISGYTQNGVFHPRLKPTVSPQSAALAFPRPAGSPPDPDHPPHHRHDGIPGGDIAHSDLGLATANAIATSILDLTYPDVHSVLLFQHGKLVFEEYFYGYSVSRTHQLRSATKTVVSTLAGIAIDRGALHGPSQPVLPLLPYSAYDHPDPRKASITVGNLLSMSSGLDCNDHSSTSPGRENVIDETPDWVKATLDLPLIHDPAASAAYCSGGVAVVGRVTELAVHQSLPAFAKANLFTPLGIAPSDRSWNYNLTSADREYSQIHLRPRDMLKLGILFANHGRWHGRQILSQAWVADATAEHSHVENVSYGYFWWRPWLNAETPSGPVKIDLVAAQGNGGQKIYLVPQFDLVAVFTGGAYNVDGTPPNAIMAKIILPALITHHPSNSVPSPSVPRLTPSPAAPNSPQ